MDKDFMNFLVNLDKEKSASDKARVNQAYSIYHSIVDNGKENHYCYLENENGKVHIISNMSADDAIKFIYTLSSTSDNEVFKAKLFEFASGIFGMSPNIATKMIRVLDLKKHYDKLKEEMEND